MSTEMWMYTLTLWDAEGSTYTGRWLNAPDTLVHNGVTYPVTNTNLEGEDLVRQNAQKHLAGDIVAYKISSHIVPPMVSTDEVQEVIPRPAPVKRTLHGQPSRVELVKKAKLYVDRSLQQRPKGPAPKSKLYADQKKVWKDGEWQEPPASDDYVLIAQKKPASDPFKRPQGAAPMSKVFPGQRMVWKAGHWNEPSQVRPLVMKETLAEEAVEEPKKETLAEEPKKETLAEEAVEEPKKEEFKEDGETQAVEEEEDEDEDESEEDEDESEEDEDESEEDEDDDDEDEDDDDEDEDESEEF